MAAWLIVLLYAVAILTIVLVHEAGHFVTAKAFGIKVEEFFVGFGPRLWSTRRGETEYGVKALPFGGYVRIAGMNPFQEPTAEEAPRTFGAKPVWQRAVVIGTGPVTHFVMAILLLGVYFSAIGVAARFRPSVDAVETQLNGHRSPAATAGFRPGDVIVAVDGQPLSPTSDPARAQDQAGRSIRQNKGMVMSITVLRDGRRVTLHATPEEATVGARRYPRLGIEMGAATVARDRLNPISAIGKGAATVWAYARAVVARLGSVFGPSGLSRIWHLLTGSQPRSANDVASVVGGGRLVVEAARAGAWDALFSILVGFNVFIGILNLVPLPPLDGGHLAVLAYEKIRGRRPDARRLVPLTALVAGFMILFAVSITYLDIVKPLPNPFP